MRKNKDCPICIYGVPMDLGQSRRGVDMGPSAIRYAGLKPSLEHLGWEVHECGNVAVPLIEETAADELSDNYPAHHITAIAQVAQDTYAAMRQGMEQDHNIIILGGDHSVSIGSIPAALHWSDNVGVIWVDAHADFNTPKTSPSGNIHGMVVTSAMGTASPLLTIGERRLKPEQIVMIGIRDLDVEERAALRESGIKVFTMRDIDELGMATVSRKALEHLQGVDTLHISFDMDSLDPMVVSGVGTPVPGGLSYREAHLLLEVLADDGRVRSMDLVEVNPILDAGNKTAETAVALVASLFGQRIL